MDFNEYQSKVKRTMKPTNPSEVEDYTIGLVGEVGELINYLKKFLFHGHNLDKLHVEEELGDILWYLCALANSMNLSMDDVAYKNIIKLEKRYPNGFTSRDSIERKDTHE